MQLADKILMLRKKAGWSQEELAEKLGVSRQAVSKWESAASVPDLDNILAMSDLFGLSLDALLRDAPAEAEPTPLPPTAPPPVSADGGAVPAAEPANVPRPVTAEEADAYIQLRRRQAVHIGIGVAICILSPIPLLLLTAAADAGRCTENLAAGLGVAALLLLVAAAVVILVASGLAGQPYAYITQEEIALDDRTAQWVQTQRQAHTGRFTVGITAGVFLCIVGVIPLIFAACMEAAGGIIMAMVVLLLLLVAAAVFLFIRVSMERGSYTSLLQEEDYTPQKKQSNKLVDAVAAVYWPLIVAIYLGVSFWTGRWDISWIIWPVAAVLFGAISGLCEAVRR